MARIRRTNSTSLDGTAAYGATNGVAFGEDRQARSERKQRETEERASRVEMMARMLAARHRLFEAGRYDPPPPPAPNPRYPPVLCVGCGAKVIYQSRWVRKLKRQGPPRCDECLKKHEEQTAIIVPCGTPGCVRVCPSPGEWLCRICASNARRREQMAAARQRRQTVA